MQAVRLPIAGHPDRQGIFLPSWGTAGAAEGCTAPLSLT